MRTSRPGPRLTTRSGTSSSIASPRTALASNGPSSRSGASSFLDLSTGFVYHVLNAGTGSAACFAYDALDRRIGTSSLTSHFNGSPTLAATWTACDGSAPYADFDASGNLATRYLRLDAGALDLLLARLATNGAVAWYLTDEEGSVRSRPRTNIRVTSRHLDHLSGNRVVISSSKRP